MNSELLDRLPPQDLDAEKGILGSMMLDPKRCDAVGLILRPEDFHADAHRKLYAHLLAMHDAGERNDAVTLNNRLKAAGDFEAIGGVAYLAEIAQAVPVAAHAVHYAEIVRDKAVLRRLIHAGAEIIRNSHDMGKTPQTAIAEAEELVNKAAGPEIATAATTAKQAIVKTLDRIDEIEGRGCGLATGFADFDRYQAGLFPGELNILAGRPQGGKTSMALQWAMYSATRGRDVLFASLEMSAVELMARVLCSHAGVDGNRLRTAMLAAADKEALVETANNLAEAALTIADPAGGLTVADIRRLARQQERRAGLSLLVIDYLQLLTPTNPRDPREQQVAKMVRELKGLARELEIPVLCLAQLNREVERAKTDHRPRLSHLRESGAIEQDGDVVMFIHREELYTRDPDDAGKAELLVAKNRNGPTRDYQLEWQPTTTTFQTPAADWEWEEATEPARAGF